MSESGIFKAAVQLAPDQRAAFLDRACGSNEELRREIESLLRSHDDSGSFLADPHCGQRVTIDYAPIAEKTGMAIGNYKLMERIGEGGMGLVFVAEQKQPVRRKVALKIIKPGMDSAQVIARFEAERQALAMMDHQNIAKVLDAGATDSGRPYFVMELVHGVPITDFCEANKLTPRQRLELFLPVCHAIQHAHQKGIIHRDIKPSNILVTLHDDKPVPKVIDFGVAKAIDQRLTEKTVYTQFGALVGTFEYMSPEQAEMNAFGVDTRSDIYALGVLLYELLTGTTPIEGGRLREAAFGEIVRLIKEEDPPRPSVRLSASGDLAKVAAGCRTDPGKLPRLVRGELDWVVMRCLEKDRSRRYDTASGLARDLERYLKDEPVEARPPSLAYRMRKFTWRNRGAVGAMAAVAIVLLAGTAVSAWQATRATFAEIQAAEERDRAVMALTEAEQSRERENAAKTAALAMAQTEAAAMRDKVEALAKLQTEAEIAKEVNEFILLLFVKSGDTRTDRQFTLHAFLEGAARRLDARRPKQPLAEAAIHELLGQGFQCCGQGAESQRQWDQAYQLRKTHLGETNAKTLVTLWWLGMAYDSFGSPAKAETAFQTMRDVSSSTYGPNHEMTRRATFNLALACKNQKKFTQAEALFGEFIAGERNSAGTLSMQTWTARAQLGQCFLEEGKYETAEKTFLAMVADASKVRILDRPAEGALTPPLYQDLVKLYDAWGKSVEASKWKNELEKKKVNKKGGD